MIHTITLETSIEFPAPPPDRAHDIRIEMPHEIVGGLIIRGLISVGTFPEGDEFDVYHRIASPADRSPLECSYAMPDYPLTSEQRLAALGLRKRQLSIVRAEHGGIISARVLSVGFDKRPDDTPSDLGFDWTLQHYRNQLTDTEFGNSIHR
jgi:hypothetical protein